MEADHTTDDADEATDSMNQSARRTARMFTPLLAGLYAILLVFPVEYDLTRRLTVLGAALLWGLALFAWWRSLRVRVVLFSGLALILGFLALPGRPVAAEGLRRDYRTGLSLYQYSRYVWGGEKVTGIDCSGLVREGFVWGQILNGVRTLNGTPIRDGVSLWWHDTSALALRDGYRGLTRPLFEAESIKEIGTARLEVGDLAVSQGGAHVLVYVGDATWTEADPGAKKVIDVTTPSDDGWFNVPVVVVRWTALDD